MALAAYLKTEDTYLQDSGLPPEVLSVLPHDSFLQLELAYKITCHAYTQQVTRLENEAQQMQSTIGQNVQHIKSLERRVASMEAEMYEHQQRARQSIAEQQKLAAEKNALIETVKRLNRELARLEHFKKNLLQQLQDEEQADVAGHFAPSMAAVDLTTERLVSEVLQSADGIAAAAGGMSSAYGQQQPQQQLQQEFRQQPGVFRSAAARSSPTQAGALGGAGSVSRLPDSPGSGKPHASTGPSSNSATIKASATSPTGRSNGTGVRSPAGDSAAAVPGQLGAGRFASPPANRTQYTGGAGSGVGAAAAARAAGASMTSPRIDGKEFFRQARARLSYEQFSKFLAAIKELNGGRATKEETLSTARRLFGQANSDLYGLFEGLLVRHLTTL